MCATSRQQQLTRRARRDSRRAGALATVDDVEGSARSQWLSRSLFSKNGLKIVRDLVEAMGRLDRDPRHQGRRAARRRGGARRRRRRSSTRSPAGGVGHLDGPRSGEPPRRIGEARRAHVRRVLAQTRDARRADLHRRERVREHGGKLEPVEAQDRAQRPIALASCGPGGDQAGDEPAEVPRGSSFEEGSPSSARPAAPRGSTSSAAFAARPAGVARPRLGQTRLAEQFREPRRHLGVMRSLRTRSRLPGAGIAASERPRRPWITQAGAATLR